MYTCHSSNSGTLAKIGVYCTYPTFASRGLDEVAHLIPLSASSHCSMGVRGVSSAPQSSW